MRRGKVGQRRGTHNADASLCWTSCANDTVCVAGPPIANLLLLLDLREFVLLLRREGSVFADYDSREVEYPSISSFNVLFAKYKKRKGIHELSESFMH